MDEFLKYVLVFAGSGAGGVSRYALSKAVYEMLPWDFPIGTLAVNLLGCLVIGFLSGVFGHWVISPDLRLLVFVGFLGGFTTFSTFGLETFDLFRESGVRTGLMNILLTNIAGIGLVVAGFALFHLMAKFAK